MARAESHSFARVQLSDQHAVLWRLPTSLRVKDVLLLGSSILIKGKDGTRSERVGGGEREWWITNCAVWRIRERKRRVETI